MMKKCSLHVIASPCSGLGNMNLHGEGLRRLVGSDRVDCVRRETCNWDDFEREQLIFAPQLQDNHIFCHYNALSHDGICDILRFVEVFFKLRYLMKRFGFTLNRVLRELYCHNTEGVLQLEGNSERNQRYKRVRTWLIASAVAMIITAK